LHQGFVVIGKLKIDHIIHRLHRFFIVRKDEAPVC